ncbi:twin-arginine translocation pathway signal protein [Neisseria gonorrhoeae]
MFVLTCIFSVHRARKAEAAGNVWRNVGKGGILICRNAGEPLPLKRRLNKVAGIVLPSRQIQFVGILPILFIQTVRQRGGFVIEMFC